MLKKLTSFSELFVFLKKSFYLFVGLFFKISIVRTEKKQKKRSKGVK